MNNLLGSISYKYISTIIMILVCLFLLFAIFNYELLVPLILKIVAFNKVTISFITIFSFVAIVFSFIFLYEYKRNSILRLSYNEKIAVYKKELEDLYVDLPGTISHTFFIKELKDYSYALLNKGNLESFENSLYHQREIISYLAKMKNLDYTVRWNEERHFLNKFLELVGSCIDITKFKIELFEPTANYRFPLGLFLVPLINAVEFALQNRGSSIKVECFTVDGLWNCQISNYVMPFVRSKFRFKYRGLSLVKKCLIKGNWAIRLSRIQVDQGMIVVIVGKYIK